ncbi:GntR family transcriptional regulator [Methylophilus aquaticus]|uniref:GntR family transcriptional regulator n=1 Tax=Methylophilus aquaticus TaxID=1971610 RepID=A0ABT9JV02_9PROT|nr:GntR family transcriptional regulator [Methylophilus aquaticus]MDP8568425.1 GntR family transcriptional regulator [Methylophilus aquaticus]
MLRPWHYSLELDKTSPDSIHQQLTRHFRSMIEGGRWLGGSLLPSTRDIAQQLGINRKTVARVYEELSAQGLIYTEPKRGTFVSDTPNGDIPGPYTTSVNTAAISEGMIQPAEGIRLLIQKTSLHHTRRAALHMHKLQPQDYDQGGLLSLKHMLANLLAHEKRFLVSPQEIICSNSLTLELAVIELLKQRGGYLLVDHDMPAPLSLTLEKHGLQLLRLPAISGGYSPALAEQLEKYCINYPVTAIWHNSVIASNVTNQDQEQAHSLIARKLQDYQLLLIDDQRLHPAQTQPLAAKYPQKSLMLGSLYGMWCDMFNIHYIASAHSLTESLLCSIQLQQQQSMLLNMLAQSELIKRGDYKKLMSAAHRLL